ncbi:uncharacterized protein [Setaria viridis]|uniref:uncharacterized protein n=1 Tax=Setaria viridis TaxID=4556 RepID=UPI003B3B8B20
MSRPDFKLFNDFKMEADTLPEIIAKRREIDEGTAGAAWTVVDDFVMNHGRIFVPSSSSLWPQILEAAHGTRHEGVQKTLQRLQASFYTPGAAKLVRQFVQDCLVCQRNKTEHLHPAGLLQPLDVPSSVWSDIAMDFVEGLAWVASLDKQLQKRDEFLAEIRERLLQAQVHMKATYDKDQLWVLERIDSVAYRLLLPPKARIHDVFHVAFLKKHYGEPPVDVVPLPAIAHGCALPTPLAIVRARPLHNSWDLLVQWVGHDPAEATWELLEDFKERYPTFQLEDKLFSQGGISVMDNFFG